MPKPPKLMVLQNLFRCLFLTENRHNILNNMWQSYFLRAVKIVASFCTYSVEPYRHVKLCTALAVTGEQRYITRDISETQKQLYLLSIFPAGGGLVTATFANLSYIY